MSGLLALAFGYVLGSIPFAFLLARRRGVDLRTAGSGNVGATNVLRTAGAGAATLAAVLDAAKGSAAVLVAQRLMPGNIAPVAAGLGSIVGHIYPPWLAFRGGKGVATAAGVFGVLAPAALALGTLAFAVTVAVSRYISAGSLVGAITLAVAALMTGATGAVAGGAACAAALIIFRHRGNVVRLIQGSERRLGVRP